MVAILLAIPAAVLRYLSIFVVISLQRLLLVLLQLAPRSSLDGFLYTSHGLAWDATIASISITLLIVVGGYRDAARDAIIAIPTGEKNSVLREHRESSTGWFCFARMMFALPTGVAIANFSITPALTQSTSRKILAAAAVAGFFIGVVLAICLLFWAIVRTRRRATRFWFEASRTYDFALLYSLILAAIQLVNQIRLRGYRVGLEYTGVLFLGYAAALVIFFVISLIKSKKEGADAAVAFHHRSYFYEGRMFHLDCLECCISLTFTLSRSAAPEEALRICRIALLRGHEHACIYAHKAVAHNRVGAYEEALEAIHLARRSQGRCSSVDLDHEAEYALTVRQGEGRGQ
jgi:hypothetical protein